jgi:hypothetical protein
MNEIDTRSVATEKSDLSDDDDDDDDDTGVADFSSCRSSLAAVISEAFGGKRNKVVLSGAMSIRLQTFRLHIADLLA